MIVIELRAIGKVYAVDGMETHALTNVNLSINAGEFVAITGPSGSGKSTLLSILGLLESPTTGDYRLAGTPIATIGRRERGELRNRQIGFVYQSFNLINELTIYENVELPLAYRDCPDEERSNRVNDALQRVGMTEHAHRHPSKLSGGEQQLVAVARAAAGDPLILLADEPTGNLDSRAGEAVLQLLSDLNRTGSTICMVTHDERLVARAQRTIMLFDGRIIGERRR